MRYSKHEKEAWHMKLYENNARDVDDLIFGDGNWNSSER